MSLRFVVLALTAGILQGCFLDHGRGSPSADARGSSRTSTPDASTDFRLPHRGCETDADSDLPGVSLDIVSDCEYTVAQAQAGINTAYQVTIRDALEGVDSGTMCRSTPLGGLHVEWQVRGGGLRHCHCDVGRCPAYTPSPTTLVPGETTGAFEWFGYDWDGPSDYPVPFGEAFEPGDYVIEIAATGHWTGESETRIPFTVRATQRVSLVP